jgi:alkanesulfonate monooxygenase SsuD/methylene tetrahydromethanopterin reductase-like flavin-dependent oxidoreductase (luciferase family)
MRYGFVVSAGSPREAGDLAAAAEGSGWDGIFTWDGIAIGEMDIYDPWVVLTVMAMRTERIRLGAIVTPPARRRPWKLARETMSVDRLSGGRLIVPVGLGALDDGAFGNVGEPTDARTRAELLDESLAIVTGLWAGKPFAHDGRHYRFGPMTFRPTPVQSPRPPIWVAATWPIERSVRRAAQWDGIIVQVNDRAAGPRRPTASDVAAIAAFIGDERARLGFDGPFDIVVEGRTRPGDTDRVEAAAMEGSGATWWIEADWEGATVASLMRRVEAGPPRSLGADGAAPAGSSGEGRDDGAG